MRKEILSITALTAIIATVFVACQDSAAAGKKSIAMTRGEMVKRGAYPLIRLDVMIVIHQKEWDRMDLK